MLLEMNMHLLRTVALLGLTTAATLALASYPTLTANGEYVSVEIRLGTDSQSAEQMPVIYQGAMSKGQVYSGNKQDGARMCGRREAMPGSKGGGWSSWYCASSYKGIQVNQPSNTNF